MGERNDRIARIAGRLPDDRAALMAYAAQAVARYHRSIIDSPGEIETWAWDHYDAVIYTLNHGTLFGSRRNGDAPGYQVDAACSAPPGQLPMWGQCGLFIMASDTMRMLVATDTLLAGLYQSVSVHAVDADRPFLSRTGFRHFLLEAQPGLSIEDVLSREVKKTLEETPAVMIEAGALDRVKRQRCVPWIADALDASPLPATYHQDNGQGAFAF